MGEYDIRSRLDGIHEDIEIVRQIPHEKWNRALLLNDIAIVQLARDVTFTGIEISNEIPLMNSIHSIFFYSDRISPICLPDTETIENYNYVGSNPFVAGQYHVI